MKLKVWGARGSVPAPGPEMNRYGGNTSCVELDALGRLDADPRRRHRHPQPRRRHRRASCRKINILLTHLHLDHIQGLMFFAPCFRSETEITIWGPSSPEASLEDRIARYISAPLSPGRGPRAALRGLLPRHARRPSGRSARRRIRAESVTHRGPTLGYRITDGRHTLTYIPDHEPGLGAAARERWSPSGSPATTSPATPTC